MSEDTIVKPNSPEDITDEHVDAVVAHLTMGGDTSLSAINGIFNVDRRKTGIARALLRHVSMKHPDLVDPETITAKRQTDPTTIEDPIIKLKSGGRKTRKIDRTDPVAFLNGALEPFATEVRLANGSTRKVKIETISGNVVTFAFEPVEIAVLEGGQRVNLTALEKINKPKANEFRSAATAIEYE